MTDRHAIRLPVIAAAHVGVAAPRDRRHPTHRIGGSVPCDPAETASGGAVSRSAPTPTHDDELRVSTPATPRRPVTPHGHTFVTSAMHNFFGLLRARFLTRYRLRVQWRG
jgi:hypothetical protein